MRPNNAPERKKRKKIDRRKGKRFWEKNGKKWGIFLLRLDPGDDKNVKRCVYFSWSFFLFSFFPSRRIIKVETLPSSF
tara:strand:- start:284 stop:517 length:234 start_codon:yes stop_codon:yes gene_type:complete